MLQTDRLQKMTQMLDQRPSDIFGTRSMQKYPIIQFNLNENKSQLNFTVHTPTHANTANNAK